MSPLPPPQQDTLTQFDDTANSSNNTSTIIYGAVGVVALLLVLYLIQRCLKGNSKDSPKTKKLEVAAPLPPTVVHKKPPAALMPATMPYVAGQDGHLAPPVPMIPRRIYRESSAILAASQTHAALAVHDAAAAAAAANTSVAARKRATAAGISLETDVTNSHAPPPGPLVPADLRASVLAAAASKASPDGDAAAEERAREKKKKAKQRARSSAMTMNALSTSPGMMMVPGSDDLQAKLAKSASRAQRHADRASKREQELEAKIKRAHDRKRAAAPPAALLGAPLVVHDPPPRSVSASRGLAADLARLREFGTLSVAVGGSRHLMTPGSPLTSVTSFSATSDDDYGSYDDEDSSAFSSGMSSAGHPGPSWPGTPADPQLLSPIVEESPSAAPSPVPQPVVLDAADVDSGVVSSETSTLAAPAAGASPLFEATLAADTVPATKAAAATPATKVARPSRLHANTTSSSDSDSDSDSPPPVPKLPTTPTTTTATTRQRAPETLFSFTGTGAPRGQRRTGNFTTAGRVQSMDAALLARATNATHAQKEQAADALDLAIPPAGSNPTMSDASTGAAAAPVAAKPRGHLLRRGSRESNGSSGSGSERPRGFLTRIASSGIVLAPSSALAAGAAATSAAAAAANSASHALGSIESMDSTDTTLLAGGAQYVAVAAFLARAEDEMSAMRGDRVAVYRVLTDGWCLGMNLDMDRHVGFFPHYVVEE